VALNKAHTSIWVKVLIIILIVAFVSLFMYQGLYGLVALFQQPQTTQQTTTDPVALINQKNQATVDFLKQQLASSPSSYTASVNLANGYFDWANELSTPASGQSQITTAAMTAAFTQWAAARAAYDAASKLATSFDPSVQTDRSYAALYSNDATAALAIVKVVTQKAPNFSQGWVHLGIYYEALGNTAAAIPAYERYLQLDPKGQNASYVQSRLKALAGGSSTATTKTP